MNEKAGGDGGHLQAGHIDKQSAEMIVHEHQQSKRCCTSGVPTGGGEATTNGPTTVRNVAPCIDGRLASTTMPVASGCHGMRPDWLVELPALLERAQGMGIAPDLTALTTAEAWGLHQFLVRQTGGVANDA